MVFLKSSGKDWQLAAIPKTIIVEHHFWHFKRRRLELMKLTPGIRDKLSRAVASQPRGSIL